MFSDGDFEASRRATAILPQSIFALETFLLLQFPFGMALFAAASASFFIY